MTYCFKLLREVDLDVSNENKTNKTPLILKSDSGYISTLAQLVLTGLTGIFFILDKVYSYHTSLCMFRCGSIEYEYSIPAREIRELEMTYNVNIDFKNLNMQIYEMILATVKINNNVRNHKIKVQNKS